MCPLVIGSILGGALAALFSFDTVRMRKRASALAVLEPSDEPVSASHVFLVRPGVTLDEATRRAASAHARKHGLDVVDLVPRRIDSWRAIVLLLTVDPATYRQDRVAQGVTAGDALLVDRDVLERARKGADVDLDPQNAVDFAAVARVLKRYATTTFDLAVAPALDSPAVPFRERRRLLRVVFSELVGTVVAAQNALLAGAVVSAPVTGRVALGIHQLQPFLGTVGTPLAPKDRVVYSLFRMAVDLASAFGPSAPPPSRHVTPESLRPVYDALLAGGLERFFEPPRDDCPLCGGRALEKVLEVGERHQLKPGTFTLVRCDACGHVFQNPRLSIEGLDFYYRDFYDGLGGETLASMFTADPRLYRARARMVAEVADRESPPRRWLDVGAGQGHFCNVAREVLPDTTFDGLDLSDAIVDAERRGWVSRGIRGLFPEVAPELASNGSRYDVVSMSHYLEHTIDPAAEIAAAARVLPEGGLFFIELPDPESAFGRLLGKRWMPWFQPQHLHFLTAKNLERLLREHGFLPLVWHRGEAHEPVDFTLSAYVGFEALAPKPDLPWRPPGGPAASAWRRAAGVLAVPALSAAWALDHAVAPLARRPGWSNTFRVVSRKTAAA
jgi:2-polyprenyl-3-methyl-5-hydroxy-6-metoxy-1,4-benzoquinol methylase